MKYDVKVCVGSNTFIEFVYATNRNNAENTAKARNPTARYAYVIGTSS